MNRRRDYTRVGKTLVAAATLSVLLLFVAVPRSHADDRANCQQRIEQTEARLQQEIREHGEHSPQADNQRRALNEERERCWNEHHGWWNGSEHQWHNERDWDRERSRADDRANCQQRIEQTEARLQQEIREHGEHSPQADNQRRALNEERERCWNEHHGWWNGSEHQWHNERDWDRERDNPIYQSGYNEGLRWGRYDRQVNRSYRAANYKAYKKGNQVYRSGFLAGYDEGFGRRPQ